MNKKMIKKGLTCIVTLIILSAFLTGCNLGGPEGNPSGGGEPFFNGAFNNGGGEIELYVGGSPLSSYRTLARSLTEGSTLYAKVEHDGHRLHLEGVFDKQSDGFVLSAREEDIVYSIFGQLDYDGNFQFAEISVATKELGEWQLRSYLIEEDTSVRLPDDDFPKGLGGVPSGLAGNTDIWVPWFKKDDNFREWAMISPAAMVTYKFDPDVGYPQEVDRINFVDFEVVNADEVNVVTFYNDTWSLDFSELFPNINGFIDEYENTYPFDAMISEHFGQKNAGWSDLEIYFEKNYFHDMAIEHIIQNKTEIKKRFDERTPIELEYFPSIYWFDTNMMRIDIWEEWLEREAVLQANPEYYLYVAGWNAEEYFAQAEAEGQVFSVDGNNYKVEWNWFFKNGRFKQWKDSLTRSNWESIREETDKIFREYIWKYHREVTSNANYEAFLRKNGADLKPVYNRIRIGKDAFGPTQKPMGLTTSWAGGAGEVDTLAKAKAYEHVIIPEDWKDPHAFPPTLSMDGKKSEGRYDYFVPLTEILNAISSNPKIPESDFLGLTMSEVFVKLSPNGIDSFEKLSEAVKKYLKTKVPSLTIGTIDEVNMGENYVRIASTDSPMFQTYPGMYAYPIYDDMGISEMGLRESTKVRSTFRIYVIIEKFQWPEWWDPENPGWITRKKADTFMDVLKGTMPGMNLDHDFIIKESDLIDVNTWGKLAIAMGYYTVAGDPNPVKTPQLMDFVSALKNYSNKYSASKPEGVPADLQIDPQKTGLLFNGESVGSNFDPSEGDTFDISKYSYITYFSRMATEEEKNW